MKWIKDTTGRFSKRPHYLPAELDAECEAIVHRFLLDRYGAVRYPIRTDDLGILIEKSAEDLDLYADLSGEDGQVEGVTEFRLGRRPVIKISAKLSENPAMENRLRTTLTHEYGHLHFHDPLYQIPAEPNLFAPAGDQSPNAGQAHRCKRDSIISVSDRDWMEWQAGFVCGAMLMPAGPLLERTKEFRRDLCHLEAPIIDGTPEAAALITAITEDFQTSREAARVRLLQKNMVQLPGQDSILNNLQICRSAD